MLQHILPPFCFLLALALVICGFATLSVDGPEASLELHQARASVDELVLDDLEADLATRQRHRVLLLTALFGGSAVMVILGFVVMRPPRPAGA